MDFAHATDGPPVSIPELATITPVWKEWSSTGSVQHRLHTPLEDRQRPAGFACDCFVDPGDVLGQAVHEHVNVGQLALEDHDHLLCPARGQTPG